MACKGCQEAKGAADDGARMTIEDRVQVLESNQAEIVHLMTAQPSGLERGLTMAVQALILCVVAYRCAKALRSAWGAQL